MGERDNNEDARRGLAKSARKGLERLSVALT
jgi:hypothetical protein